VKERLWVSPEIRLDKRVSRPQAIDKALNEDVYTDETPLN
jgi:hypothetical protein